MNKPKIESAQILGVVKSYCAEADIDPPNELEDDFNEHLGNVDPVKSYRSIQANLCSRIKNLFSENESLHNKYAEFVGDIAGPVRLRLLKLLGLEERITKFRRNYGHSDREFLIRFLSTLKEGEKWSFTDLENFHLNGDDGVLLKKRFFDKVDKSLEVIEFLLGNKSKKLLKRNPFYKRIDKKITNRFKAKKYLLEYLGSLKDGESWSYSTLCNWVDGEVKGGTLVVWLNAHFEGSTLENINALLGSDSEALLKRNPFQAKRNISSYEDAIEYLYEFMAGLRQDEEWHPSTLANWKGKNGVTGMAVYIWITRNIGILTTEFLKNKMGDHIARALERNPFSKKESIIRSKKDAVKYLREFLDGLKDGEEWWSKKLAKWVSKTGASGYAVYVWIRKDTDDGKLTSEVVNKFLGRESKKYLERNPFTKTERQIESIKDIEIGLIEYLSGLKEGEKWSPEKLKNWVGDDGTKGVNLCHQIRKKIRIPDTRGADWLYILIKILPIEYCFRNPFTYRGLPYLKGKDDFVTSRPQFDDMSFGRGVKDEKALTPEEELIIREEQDEIDRQIKLLHDAIGRLSKSEQKIANDFLNEKEIPEEQLIELIIKLKENLGD